MFTYRMRLYYCIINDNYIYKVYNVISSASTYAKSRMIRPGKEMCVGRRHLQHQVRLSLSPIQLVSSKLHNELAKPR